MPDPESLLADFGRTGPALPVPAADIMAGGDRRRRRRHALVAGGTAAVVMLGIGAGVLANPWSTSPAAAEVISAARQTEAQDSGRVIGSIEVVSGPDGDSDVPGGRSGITAGFTLLYSGGDFDLTTRDGNGETEVIGVGDSRYTKGSGSPTFVRADGAQDSFLEDGFGIAAAGAGPDGLLDLVEQADDVTLTDGGADGGGRTFRGTVPVRALSDQDRLPPGASFFADPERLVGYPDTVAVAIEVRDGLLRRLELRMLGDTDAGHTDVTVTTTFSDIGTDQEITAPAAGQVQVEDGTCRITAVGDSGFTESAGCRTLLQTVDDFRARSPDHPCVQIDGGQPFLRCLDDSGEAEVARAFRTYLEAFPPGG